MIHLNEVKKFKFRTEFLLCDRHLAVDLQNSLWNLQEWNSEPSEAIGPAPTSSPIYKILSN